MKSQKIIEKQSITEVLSRMVCVVLSIMLCLCMANIQVRYTCVQSALFSSRFYTNNRVGVLLKERVASGSLGTFKGMNEEEHFIGEELSERFDSDDQLRIQLFEFPLFIVVVLRALCPGFEKGTAVHGQGMISIIQYMHLQDGHK